MYGIIQGNIAITWIMVKLKQIYKYCLHWDDIFTQPHKWLKYNVEISELILKKLIW